MMEPDTKVNDEVINKWSDLLHQHQIARFKHQKMLILSTHFMGQLYDYKKWKTNQEMDENYKYEELKNYIRPNVYILQEAK